MILFSKMILKWVDYHVCIFEIAVCETQVHSTAKTTFYFRDNIYLTSRYTHPLYTHLVYISVFKDHSGTCTLQKGVLDAVISFKDLHALGFTFNVHVLYVHIRTNH